MEKRQRTRYLIAIYSIVTALALIFIILAFYRTSDVWQATFLNLSTELLGVVLVFFVVNFLFLADEWNLSERIEKLLIKMESSERPSARDFFEHPPRLETYLQTASSIDFCGVTLTSAINKQLSHLRDQLKSGAKIRILIVNPNSLALQMSAARSEDKSDIDYYEKRIAATFNDLEYLYRSWEDYQRQPLQGLEQGSLAIRLLDYAPSFGLFGFNGDRANAVLFAEMYPHHSGFGAPPVFHLTPTLDGEWYTYFADQFESMWKAGTEWRPAKGEQRYNYKASSKKVRAEEFFLSDSSLSSDTFASADEICLLGYSLSRTVREHISIMEQRLAVGAQIRVIVADPQIDSLLQRIVQESVASTLEQWRSGINATINFLNAIAKNTDSKGKITVGYLPYTPAFGLKMVNPSQDDGFCFVEIYHHKTISQNATFLLTAADDKRWHKHFRTQYDILWESCRLETLPV